MPEASAHGCKYAACAVASERTRSSNAYDTPPLAAMSSWPAPSPTRARAAAAAVQLLPFCSQSVMQM